MAGLPVGLHELCFNFRYLVNWPINTSSFLIFLVFTAYAAPTASYISFAEVLVFTSKTKYQPISMCFKYELRWHCLINAS